MEYLGSRIVWPSVHSIMGPDDDDGENENDDDGERGSQIQPSTSTAPNDIEFEH